MSPSAHDEFGSISLDEMFPDLDSGPDLEQVTDFASGTTHRLVPSKFTNTHLCAVFTSYDCQNCGNQTHAAQGYSVRVVHHSRNECVEYRAISSGDLPLYKDLPKLIHRYPHSCLFCIDCLSTDYQELSE